MQRLRVDEAELMKVAVQQEILRSADSRYDHRLHGVLLICAGKSCYEVADLFGHSPRTIEQWIKRFDKDGFAGLQEGERPGRPTKLDKRLRAQINKDLRRSPREFAYAQNLWDGKLLSHHLSSVYGVELGVRQCQRLFHELGFRRRKPRAVSANANPEAQEAYKKTTPPGSKKGR
jgi:transposase